MCVQGGWYLRTLDEGMLGIPRYLPLNHPSFSGSGKRQFVASIVGFYRDMNRRGFISGSVEFSRVSKNSGPLTPVPRMRFI